jgi:hypothetical protein
MLSSSRRALLVAALGFSCCSGVDGSGVREAGSNREWPDRGATRLRSPDLRTAGLDPALVALRAWLSGWRGVGLIAAGMARQGYDLSLTRYAELGWRATFYVSGREHSPTGAAASAFEATPFGAVQVAAWETLARA